MNAWLVLGSLSLAGQEDLGASFTMPWAGRANANNTKHWSCHVDAMAFPGSWLNSFHAAVQDYGLALYCSVLSTWR